MFPSSPLALVGAAVLSLASLASADCATNTTGVVAAAQCPLQFDLRIPKNLSAAQLDAANGPFQKGNVIGKGLSLATEVQLTPRNDSLFDTKAGTVPLTVSISNNSIFAPSDTNVQVGFRRLELVAAGNNGTDASTLGVKTLHFSLRKDAAKPLNLSHEYQLMFLEDAKFSNNQFNIRTGKLNDVNVSDVDTLNVFGNSNDFKSAPALLFSTKFTADTFHNFALTLDFDKNTTQVFYSTGMSALTNVTGAVPNPLGGRGQFHFGMLKKPTDFGSLDITKNGFQEAPISEALVYGGIFMEDSSKGCISLS